MFGKHRKVLFLSCLVTMIFRYSLFNRYCQWFW